MAINGERIDITGAVKRLLTVPRDDLNEAFIYRSVGAAYAIGEIMDELGALDFVKLLNKCPAFAELRVRTVKDLEFLGLKAPKDEG
jgi:hypothetical protein